MKKISAIAVSGLLIALFALWLLKMQDTHNAVPPSSVSVYVKLNDYWVHGCFAKMDSYVKGLQGNRPGYVPSRLVRATYAYKNKVDIEQAVLILEETKHSTEMNWSSYSPLFVELLDGVIYRYKDVTASYKKMGLTKDRLFTIYNPRTMTPAKRSKRWGDENLFFNAPEVLMTNNLVIPIQPAETVAPSPSMMAKTERELKLIICGDNTPILERKAAVKALVSQRRAVGLKEVAKGLYEAELLYTYNDTADEVVRARAAAVPVILGLLNDPAQRISQKKFVIWPLVRIGDTRPEVLQTLQKLATNATVSTDDRAYAERALRHLQQGRP